MRVGARLVDLPHDVPHRRKEGRELHRHRNLQNPLELGRDVPQLMLDGRARHVEIGDDLIHVDLEAVRPGLLQQMGDPEPRLGRRAVQRGDHRDLDGALHLPQMLQVVGRTIRILARRGEMRQRIGKRGVQGVPVVDLPRRGEGDLFLEERVEHNGRTSGVLEPPHGIEVGAERGGAGNERMAEAQAHVSGRRAHVRPPCGQVLPGRRAWAVPPWFSHAAAGLSPPRRCSGAGIVQLLAEIRCRFAGTTVALGVRVSVRRSVS